MAGTHAYPVEIAHPTGQFNLNISLPGDHNHEVN
jgi:hypothetical protein